MANPPNLPDEVLLHIIEALFKKFTINLAKPRPIEITRKKRHRRSILCVTAVSHKFRSIALATLEKYRDEVEYSLDDVMEITGALYYTSLSKLPFSKNLVNLTMPPGHAAQICNSHAYSDYWGNYVSIIHNLTKTFPRLDKMIAKSEGSDLHGFIDKDEDATGWKRYYKETKFVAAMVKTVHYRHVSQHRRFIASTHEVGVGTIQPVSEITFKWMGQTVSS